MKLRDVARAFISKKSRGVAWYKVSQKKADKYGFYVYSRHMGGTSHFSERRCSGSRI